MERVSETAFGADQLQYARLGVLMEYLDQRPNDKLSYRLANLITNDQDIAKALAIKIAQGDASVVSELGLRVIGCSSTETCDASFDKAAARIIPAVRVLFVGRVERLAEGSAKAASPWTPLVVLAHCGIEDDQRSSLETKLASSYLGSEITWVDLEDPREPKTHPLWPFGREKQEEDERIAVLSSEGLLSRALQKRLGKCFELIEVGSPYSENTDIEGALVIELSADWAYTDSRRPTLSRPKLRRKNEQNDVPSSQPENSDCSTFVSRLRLFLRCWKGEIVICLKSGKSISDLAEEIRNSLGGYEADKGVSLRLLSPAFDPILSQVGRMSRRQRMSFIRLLLEANAAPPDDDALRSLDAELIATTGAERVIRDGVTEDIKSAAARKITDARARISRLVAHGFDRIQSDVVAAAYLECGDSAEAAGAGGDPSWLHAKDWVEAETDHHLPWPSRMFDTTQILCSSGKARVSIAKSISRYLSRELMLLSLCYELFWARFIRENIMGCLKRDPAFNDQKKESDVGDYFPLRRTRDTAGIRACEAVTGDRICDAVKRWPEIKKVPAQYNINIATKSIQRIVRQGSKLIAASFIVLPIFHAFSPSKFKAKVAFSRIGDWFEWWLIVPFLIAGAIMLYTGIDALRARREPMYDSLRDQTHDVLEKAAIERLKAAKVAFEEVCDRDLQELEVQLLRYTDIAAVAPSGRSKVARLQAAILRLKDEIKKVTEIHASATNARLAARKSAIAVVNKAISLGSVSEPI